MPEAFSHAQPAMRNVTSHAAMARPTRDRRIVEHLVIRGQEKVFPRPSRTRVLGAIAPVRRIGQDGRRLPEGGSCDAAVPDRRLGVSYFNGHLCAAKSYPCQ